MAVERMSQGYFCPVWRLVRFSVRKTGVFSWALPTKRMPSVPSNLARYSRAMSSLRCPLANLISGIWFCWTKRSTAATNPLTLRIHEGRGGEGVSPVKAPERGNTTLALELGLVDVEVQAVDTLDFQGHMLADDLGDGARYTHGWLRSSRLLEGPPTAKRFYWGCFQYTPFLGTTGAFLHLVGLRRSLVRSHADSKRKK